MTIEETKRVTGHGGAQQRIKREDFQKRGYQKYQKSSKMKSGL